MSNLEDKINKLIKLATNNPNEEEAKLAALKACVIIQEKELKIGEKSQRVRINTWDEHPNRAREAAEWARQRVAKMKEEARQNMWKKIVLKSRHQCSRCDETIPIGEEVLWSKGGTGVFHINCWVEYRAGI